MDVIAAGLFSLIGLALGGGLNAWQKYQDRRHESTAILSALVAEVEALTRLVSHRGFFGGIISGRDHCKQLVESGRGSEPGEIFVFHVTGDYFHTFHALNSKIGYLHPYHADRIVRFYVLAKAALENYSPSSPFQAGITAAVGVEMYENDAQLVAVLLQLGGEITSFRTVAPPTGSIVPPELSQPGAASDNTRT